MTEYVLNVPSCAEIGKSAYRNQKNLKKVVLPKGIERVGDHAFAGCEGLEEIDFPNGLRVIGHGAFNGCVNLKRVVLPKSLEYLGNRAFGGCTRLEYVEINGTQTKTEEHSPRSADTAAFRGCTSLKELYVANGVTRLSYYMFAGCKALKAVRLPKSLEQISNTTFEGVPAEQFANKLRFVEKRGIGKVLVNAFNVTGDVVVPGDVAEIGYCAFYGQHPNSVTVENGVESIGSYAFGKYTGLPLILPPSVRDVAWDAFDSPTSFIASERCRRLCYGGWGHQYATPTYEDGQYKSLLSQMKRCETVLKGNPDVNAFMDILDRMKRILIGDTPDGPLMAVARRLRGIERIFTADVFGQVAPANADRYLDFAFSFLPKLVSDRVEVPKFFMEVLERKDVKSAGWTKRRLRFLVRLLRREMRSPAMPLVCRVDKWWPQPADGGGLHEWNRIRTLPSLRRVRAVKDPARIEEVKRSTYSRCRILLDLSGVSTDHDVLANLVKLRAVDNLVAFYKENPGAESMLPKSDLVLHACLTWDEMETVDLIRELTRSCHLSGEGLVDRAGNGPFLYLLYNVLRKRRCRFTTDDVVKKLERCGCSGAEKLVFGYSYNEIAEAMDE